MVKRVELPSGQVAEFPDDMGNEEISSVIQKQFPQQRGRPEQEKERGRGARTGGVSIEEVKQGATNALANLNVGIARLFGMPGEIGDLVGGATGTGESLLPDTEEVQSFMADMGMTFQPENTPQDITSRTVQEFGTALVPALGAIGRGTTLARTGTQAAGLLERGAVQAAQRPGTALAVEAGAAAGAAGGGKLLERTFPENPTLARAIGELAGGLTGGGAVGAAQGVSKGIGTLVRRRGLIGAATEPFTAQGARRRASTRLFKQTQDFQGDIEKLDDSLIRQEVPQLTPAQETGDPFLAQLERAVASEDDAVQEVLAQRTAQSSQRLKEIATDTGDPEDVRRYLDERLKNVAAQASKNSRRIRQAGDPATISSRVRSEIEGALDNARSMERRVWQSVPKEVTATPSNTRQAWLEELQDISPGSDPAEIPNIIKKKLGNVQDGVLQGGELGDNPSAKSLHDFYSVLGRKVQQEANTAGGNPNKIRILKKIRSNILADLENVDGGEMYQEAISLSRDLNSKFTQGPIGDVLGFSKAGAPMDATQTLDALIGNDGQEARLAVKQLLEASPQSEQKLKNFIRSKFAKAAFDPENNTLNTKSAQGFFRKYDPLLKEFPDLRRELGSSIGDQRKVDDLLGATKVEAQSPIVRQKEAASIFLQEDPEKAIGRILRGKNRVKSLQSIMRELKRADGTDKSLQGLKAAVPDYLMKRSISNLEDEMGQAVVSGKRFLRQLDDFEKPLVESGLMTKGEINRLRRIGKAFEGIETSLRARPSTGGVISDRPAKILEIAARVGGAQVGGKVGASSAGGSLQSAQIASKEAQNFIARLTNDKARQLLTQAVQDPEVMKDLLRNINNIPPSKQGKFFSDLGVRVGIPKTAITAPVTTGIGGKEEVQGGQDTQENVPVMGPEDVPDQPTFFR